MTRSLLLVFLSACSPALVDFDPGATKGPDDSGVIDSGDADTDTDTDSDTDTDADTDTDTDTDADTDTACLEVWYRDADGDRYGDAADTTSACEQPDGYVDNANDCDDADGAVYPLAPESCNGVDDDCDGQTDEAGASGGSTWYKDGDGDGYGDLSATRTACDAPSGYVASSTDCDDTDAAVHPGAVEVAYDLVDNDCDGVQDAMAVADVSGWTIDGVTASDALGSGGLLVGEDLDGDGNTDLAIGAPLYDASDKGAVALHDADDAGLDVAASSGWALLAGASSGDRLGSALASLGDADRDGHVELAVGAYLDNNNDDTDAGIVYFLDVNAISSASATSIESVDDGNATGTDGSAYAGYALGAGDLDGDGARDLAVGSPGYDGTGAAYVLLGDDEYWRQSSTVGQSNLRADGAASGDDLGYAVLLAELTGDGHDDLVACGSGDDTAGSGAGACWIVEGESDPEWGGTVTSLAYATITGDAAGDAVGYGPLSLFADDFDGDGEIDLAVGAPGSDAGSPEGGAVGVFFGPLSEGTTTAVSGADVLVLGDGALGRAVASGDDADNDGAVDLLLGAPTAGEGVAYLVTALGAASRVSLPDDASASWTGAAASDSFGSALASGADLDGDGVGDLVAAATGNDDAASGAGKVYVLPGY